ncbi:hypothetical protein PPYR_08108 [Photinus pyralis]|uniref:Uncharacterized protein n=1 Tax=Photinus pyralis TaxID=7054 RepID=A0A5N4AIH6_PHOPY|nr:hypothetical protein PPYR_08108 [Photinus pyralis]
MKPLITFLVILCTTTAFKFNVNPELTKKWIAMIGPYNDQCATENAIDKNKPYKAILNMNYPENRSFQCYAECIWWRWGFYDSETDTIDGDKIEKVIAGFTKGDTEQCFKTYKMIDDHCQKIFSTIKCCIGKLMRE